MDLNSEGRPEGTRATISFNGFSVAALICCTGLSAIAQTNNIPGNPVVVQGNLGVKTSTPQLPLTVIHTTSSSGVLVGRSSDDALYIDNGNILRNAYWNDSTGVHSGDTNRASMRLVLDDWTFALYDGGSGTVGSAVNWVPLLSSGSAVTGAPALRLFGGLQFPDGTVQTSAASGGPTPTSINGYTGAVTLTAGSNVSLTPAGNGLSISASTTSVNGATGAVTLVGANGATINRSGNTITITAAAQRYSVCVSNAQSPTPACGCSNSVSTTYISGGASCTTQQTASPCTANTTAATQSQPQTYGVCCVCQ